MNVDNESLAHYCKYRIFSFLFVALSAFFAYSNARLFKEELILAYRFFNAGMLDSWLTSYLNHPFTTGAAVILGALLFIFTAVTGKLALECHKRSRKINLLEPYSR